MNLKYLTYALFIFGAIFFMGCQSNNEIADTIYTNGKIYTVNEDQAWAEAVAIKEGKFLLVGTNDEIKELKGHERMFQQ